MDKFAENFDEFVAERCEKTTSTSLEYTQMVREIINISNKIKESLSKEQYIAFLKYESLSLKIQSCAEVLMYKRGISDSKSIFNTAQDTAQKF